MVNYETVKETFEKQGCKLLTSENEFKLNKLTATSKYTIVASCGHQIEGCWYHMFKYRGSGKICKNCIDIEHSKRSVKLNKNLEEGNSHALNIEHESIELIKKYINNTINLCVSPECCNADIAIKPTSFKSNEWLPIQVKSTLKGKHNIYSFQLHRNYNDMLMIFICIEEELFWLMNGNVILDQCKLSIGMKKSKYNYYKVDKNDLSKVILKYYETMEKDTLKNIQTPITKCYKIEQKFRKLREEKLYDIHFESPIINQSVYDFKVNDYKIQEKNAFIKKERKTYMVFLTKNKGGDQNNPYEKGDNDFYWINLQDNETFYIISEQILIEKQIISTENKKGKPYVSFAARNTWLNEYKFNYNEYNINEIIKNYLK